MSSIKFFIDLMQSKAAKTNKELAKELNITTSAFTQWSNTNFDSFTRFIKTAAICSFTVHIKSNDNLMDINISDIVLAEDQKR